MAAWVFVGFPLRKGRARARGSLSGVDVVGGTNVGPSASGRLREVLPGWLGRRVGPWGPGSEERQTVLRNRGLRRLPIFSS